MAFPKKQTGRVSLSSSSSLDLKLELSSPPVSPLGVVPDCVTGLHPKTNNKITFK